MWLEDEGEGQLERQVNWDLTQLLGLRKSLGLYLSLTTEKPLKDFK